MDGAGATSTEPPTRKQAWTAWPKGLSGKRFQADEFRVRALIQSSPARLIFVIRVGLIVACTRIDPRSDTGHIVA